MVMRIALVGPGAIGATVAALLHAAGHQVIVCGRSARESIEVRPDPESGVSGPLVAPGPVVTDPVSVTDPVDVVLWGVKDTQNAGASVWLDRLCGDDTIVCALQNGVEQVERVGRYRPGTTVVPSVVWISAERQAEGWVRLRTAARLVLPDDDAGRRLAGLLRVPGLTVENDPDYVSAAWHKLLTNAVAGLMVLTGRRSGMYRRDDIAELTRRYGAECLAVARAEGASLGDDVPEQLGRLFASVPEDLTTSMLTDREARVPLEWDIRNGVILRKARAHGLPAPMSEVLVPLLAAASDGPG
ncbi:oxidoreductase [Mycobacterium sp. ITM-2016-00317]|uniref:oxidoreductase n=1 Tax=Mycobacterium sp. ITM-2016-00317 TaxID=2099694 RepID=UPI00287FD880|nr:oxidoreductase [Mycobacterium sp. ITM-2016-00317]WNG89829.1 oxidoreductase [Mycobacterium sp. ITM-2016-00317]